MSFYHNPRVITDGVVLYYDAKNNKSAKSGSASWNDLVGDNHATYYNATYSNEGYYEIDINGAVTQTDAIAYPSESSWTFSQWQQKPSGSNMVWKAFCGTNIQGPGGYFYYAPILRYYQAYFDSTYYGVMQSDTIDGSFTFNPTSTTGSWFNITIAYNGDTHGMTVMVNGDEFVETRTVSWSTVVENFQFKYIGNLVSSGGTKGFEGYIATHMVWNRELSLEENKSNYIATKGRFGK